MNELTAEGIPVAATCRVLNIARQPYYQWRARPVTATELERAHPANALFEAHRDEPEFGYRFLADEARDAGWSMADRTGVADLLVHGQVEHVRQETRPQRQEDRPTGPR